MDNKKVSVIIYTEEKDNSLLYTAIKQSVPNNINVDISDSDKFQNKSFDISIVRITDKTSDIIFQVINQKNLANSDFIFVLESQDLLLSPTLAKLGFTELFLFPDELFKFTNYIAEKIENLPEPGISEFGLYSIEALIGSGENSKETIAIAKKAAQNPGINVLITGESGTGKGMLANAIHNFDKENKDNPFIEVICTAIPGTLLESELFGYERGAFTDAKSKKAGLLELAESGTIFFDEIGDLSLELQAKLLKVIDKKVFRRVGGVKDIPLNARIISATNKNLKEMVNQKTFRLDLYYRISVVSINLKPLRERKIEILPLAKHLIKIYSENYKKPLKKIENSLFNYLVNYRWPGNFREFKNTIDMAILMLEDDVLRLDYFKNFIQVLQEGEFAMPESENKNLINLKLNPSVTDLTELNKIYAKEVLDFCKNNKSKTAKILNISRPKLDNLLK